MYQCVYIVKNDVTGSVYVGRTENLERRWKEHLRARGHRAAPKLREALDKYGPSSFSVRPSIFCLSKKLALKVEKRLTRLKGSVDVGGYNLCEGAAHHAVTQRKLSDTYRNPPSPEEKIEAQRQRALRIYMRPCVVDGVIYSTVRSASAFTGVARYLLRSWADKKDSRCSWYLD